MMGYIGNTDFRWFSFLKNRQQEQGQRDEINFWKPSDTKKFRALKQGEPFFFRLKAPYRKIAGFGWFERHVELHDWLAWQTFGGDNGASSETEFFSMLNKYRTKNESQSPLQVGCILLLQPTFFDEKDWIDQPPGWQDNIVQGKRISLEEAPGKYIFESCKMIAQAQQSQFIKDVPGLPHLHLQSTESRYGNPILVRPRLGQGTFRVAVIDAYARACSITNEHSLPVLQAAHIQPYAQGGPHDVSNGLLLRSDLHALFDLGYLTVSSDYHVELSRRLRADYGNGRTYEAFHGQKLHLPDNPQERPSHAYLKWHQDHVFKAA